MKIFNSTLNDYLNSIRKIMDITKTKQERINHEMKQIYDDFRNAEKSNGSMMKKIDQEKMRHRFSALNS